MDTDERLHALIALLEEKGIVFDFEVDSMARRLEEDQKRYEKEADEERERRRLAKRRRF